MKRILQFIVAALLTGVVAAQNTREPQQERAALEKGQNALVSTFDNSLPRVSLKFFLERESDGAKIHWETNDCGEQTGNPANSPAEIPICVEANFATADGRTVDVMVAVGSSRIGVSGAPVLFSCTITDEKGAAHPVKLIELPAKDPPQWKMAAEAWSARSAAGGCPSRVMRGAWIVDRGLWIVGRGVCDHEQCSALHACPRFSRGEKSTADPSLRS